MQRRRLLKLGVVSAAAIGVVGSVALLLQEPEIHDRPLTGPAFEVLSIISAVLLDGSVPADGQGFTAALAGYPDRLADTVSGLPMGSQRELGQVLSLLALAPGRRVFSSLATDWPIASREEIRNALETMRRSRIKIRRQIYHALRDLARAAWYADPTTWVALGYPGPRAIA